MNKNVILINPHDNVATAIQEIKAGTPIVGVPEKEPIAAENIPAAHKIALVEIPAGQPILKYGEPIGLAKNTIQPGQLVHTHNITHEDE